ncbi:TetR/AcrR family transcriptional regulator [Oceanimonas sp. CHS3-5]|uniref:TetR/AcrR family transcriptional regulator n=1 Tax=Oceanimonas sp. CHS3-5 TaxID=3068186 RepID=UPI00273E0D18|nr:TetR/AcrR family transcriptional regulator [Oceanimonas sp. CHS3-5]MDP5293620.1 TetR/AcrR family transcriptional regulator [Oceanimonas sp. CHS3-5]
MTHLSAERDAILDTALHLALHRGWHGFSLRELAEVRELSLADLSRHFRSRDDLAEALFDRADDALLSLPLDPQEPMHERLLTGIMVWLDYLAPYRNQVKEMLGYKLEPGHCHLQAHGITRISRTVQWLLESADWQASGLRRSAGEVALTGIYLTAVASFMVDASDNLNTTRTLVHGLLTRSGRLLQ